MNILTKICIVIQLVLILLACPVFITQATVVANYRDRYEKQVLQSEVLNQIAAQAQMKIASVKIERDTAVADKTQLAFASQQEIAKLRSDVRLAQMSNGEQENRLDKLATEVAGLKQQAQVFNERSQMLEGELKIARAEFDKLTAENISTTEQLRAAEVAKTRTEKTSRVRYERIRELEEEVGELRSGGAVARKDAGPEVTLAPGDAITGTVTAVRGDYASINIGSAKRVARGMRLIIYRGTEVVGFLRVEEVDVAESAGIIVDSRLDTLQGDKVTTSLMN